MSNALALAFPPPALGTTRRWTVPLPTSWNHRYQRTHDGGLTVRDSVAAWERVALMSLRAQGWRPLDYQHDWGLGVQIYEARNRADLDKRICTLIDFLKKPQLVGRDDKFLRSLIVEKLIDRRAPRCEFIVWEYVPV